jgi:hypothetical protein
MCDYHTGQQFTESENRDSSSEEPTPNYQNFYVSFRAPPAPLPPATVGFKREENSEHDSSEHDCTESVCDYDCTESLCDYDCTESLCDYDCSEDDCYSKKKKGCNPKIKTTPVVEEKESSCDCSECHKTPEAVVEESSCDCSECHPRAIAKLDSSVVTRRVPLLVAPATKVASAPIPAARTALIRDIMASTPVVKVEKEIAPINGCSSFSSSIASTSGTPVAQKISAPLVMPKPIKDKRMKNYYVSFGPKTNHQWSAEITAEQAIYIGETLEKMIVGPTIHVSRGTTYVFTITQTPNEKGKYTQDFLISTLPVGGSRSKYYDISEKPSNITNGKLVFEVTEETNDVLFYGSTASMYNGGLIIVHRNSRNKK